MSIKSILCVYGGAFFEEMALAASLKLAARFQAEVRFLHISVPLDVYPELYGVTLYGQAVAGDAGVLGSIAEANEAQQQIAQASVMPPPVRAISPSVEKTVLATYPVPPQPSFVP